jgi:hypothetical protein
MIRMTLWSYTNLTDVARGYHRGYHIDSLLTPGHVRQVGPIALFLHDSDHAYPWQMWELETSFRHRSTQFVWACDDVDSSFAFLDFCGTHKIRPIILMDTRKFFGLGIS